MNLKSNCSLAILLLQGPVFSAENTSGNLNTITTDTPDAVATGIVMKPIYPISVHAVAFSPDGKIVAGGHGTGQLRLWDVDSGKMMHDLQAHSNWVFAITFTHDGSRIITGGGDNLIHWFNASEPGTPEKTIKAHSKDVHAVAVTRDERTLFSAADDRQIVLWDVRRDAAKESFIAHDRQIPTLILSPNERILASGSRDRSIKLWNARNGKLRDTLLGHTGDVMALSFSRDGSLLASAGWDSTVRIWDVDKGKAVRIIAGDPMRVSGVAFAPDGKRVVSSRGRQLQLLDLDKKEQIWSTQFKGRIQGPENTDTAEDLSMVTFSPDGKRIAVGSTTGAIYLVSPETGKVERTLKVTDSRRD